MPAKKKKANQQQLQTQRAPQRQLSPVLLFSKRARTWIVAACSIAIICFVMLPLGLDRLSSANTQEAAAYQAADAAAPTPAPEAAAALPATAEPEAATPAPTQEMRVSEYSTLREGDRYPAVLELHARLVSLGYLESDEPSETYNEATASAVALFQRTLNLDMTGVADSQLQEQLFSTDAAPYEAKLGDDGADVRSMQSRLAQLGYYEEKVNGYFGVATEEALRAFQLKNELNADGVYGMDERELIYSADARPAVDPPPPPAPNPPPPAPTPRAGGTPSWRPLIDDFSSIPGKECGMETCFHGKKKDLCADWCRGKTGETSFAEFARPEKKRWFPKGRSGALRVCRIPVPDSASCFLPSVFAGASRAHHRLHALRLQLTKSRFCKIKLSRNYNSS